MRHRIGYGDREREIKETKRLIHACILVPCKCKGDNIKYPLLVLFLHYGEHCIKLFDSLSTQQKKVHTRDNLTFLMFLIWSLLIFKMFLSRGSPENYLSILTCLE